MLKKTLVLCAFVMFGLSAQICAAQDNVASASSASAEAAMVAPTAQYRLGGGDSIHMNVFGETDLSGDFKVTGDGKLSLPLIGEVPAAGLTVSQLQETIQTAYMQGFLKDPKINIEVTNFRPFYIMGEVGKPGEYPYSDGITVLNAVALAEGFTYRAQTKKVFIRHVNEDKETPVPLSSSLLVTPGDTIRIGERYF